MHEVLFNQNNNFITYLNSYNNFKFDNAKVIVFFKKFAIYFLFYFIFSSKLPKNSFNFMQSI
ncbi:MAG: hypothetical protein EAZ85_14315 [Bacteroidetes bacterium]|nr:MAG: hypothetical protein EAZ85_14315 [Bacteroidota bacterium]TAG87733.1 MAG: hypothetical protein EAZ20_10005 [Bacteroidota bacterium]